MYLNLWCMFLSCLSLLMSLKGAGPYLPFASLFLYYFSSQPRVHLICSSHRFGIDHQHPPTSGLLWSIHRMSLMATVSMMDRPHDGNNRCEPSTTGSPLSAGTREPTLATLDGKLNLFSDPQQYVESPAMLLVYPRHRVRFYATIL